MVEAEPPLIPAVPERDLQKILPLEKRDDVVRLILHIGGIIVAARGKILLPDALAVEARFVEAETRHIQPRFDGACRRKGAEDHGVIERLFGKDERGVERCARLEIMQFAARLPADDLEIIARLLFGREIELGCVIFAVVERLHIKELVFFGRIVDAHLKLAFGRPLDAVGQYDIVQFKTDGIFDPVDLDIPDLHSLTPLPRRERCPPQSPSGRKDRR